jgi:hypothetical protein
MRIKAVPIALLPSLSMMIAMELFATVNVRLGVMPLDITRAALSGYRHHCYGEPPYWDVAERSVTGVGMPILRTSESR